MIKRRRKLYITKIKCYTDKEDIIFAHNIHANSITNCYTLIHKINLLLSACDKTDCIPDVIVIQGSVMHRRYLLSHYLEY